MVKGRKTRKTDFDNGCPKWGENHIRFGAERAKTDPKYAKFLKPFDDGHHGDHGEHH